MNALSTVILTMRGLQLLDGLRSEHYKDYPKDVVRSAIPYYVLRAVNLSGPTSQYPHGLTREDVLRETMLLALAAFNRESTFAALHTMLNDCWIRADWPIGDAHNTGPRFSLTTTGVIALGEAFRFLVVAGAPFRTCDDCGERIDNFASRRDFGSNDTYF